MAKTLLTAVKHTRIPYSILRTCTPTACEVAGVLRSFSDANITYRATQAQTGKSLRKSRSSIFRAFSALKSSRIIEKTSDPFTWKYARDPEDNFLIIPSFLHDTVEWEDQKITLTESEKVVFSFCLSFDKGDEKKHGAQATLTYIANCVGLSRHGVEKAVQKLKKYGLLFVHPVRKLKNGKTLNELKANCKFFRTYAKQERISGAIVEKDEARKKDPKNAEIEAINERGAREHYYAVLRENAQRRVDDAFRRARTVEGFTVNEKALKKIEIDLAKAEVLGGDVASVERQKSILLLERKRLLKQAGIKASALIPTYACTLCQDTGFLPDGRACGCYQKE